MRFYAAFICLVFQCFPTTDLRASSVYLIDLETASVYDATSVFEGFCNGKPVDSICAVDVMAAAGDDWIMIQSGGRIIGVDSNQFSLIFDIDESSFRTLWGLNSGTGRLTTIHQTLLSDLILYLDQNGAYYYIDPVEASFGPWDPAHYGSDLISGFGYRTIPDDSVFRLYGDGWHLEKESGASIPVDFRPIIYETPWMVSQIRIGQPPDSFEYLLAVVPGEVSTPTPTPHPTDPEPSPTPSTVPGTATPTPPDEFHAVIAMNLAESLWTVDGQTYETNPNAVLTGNSPNDMVTQNEYLYVVNSLSHSIYVYDASTLQHQQGKDISLGDSRNPFQMVFSNPDKAFVTNFIRNTVSVVRPSTASVIDEISLPGSEDLPHDPGTQTSARPEGLTVAGSTCYVACCNLGNDFTAGGPGVVCMIDTASNSLLGWFESGGRNTVDVVHDVRYPDWIWTVNAGDYDTGFAGNGNIGIYSIPQAMLIDTIETGEAPFEILITDSRIYIANGRTGTVLRLTVPGFETLPALDLPGVSGSLSFVSGLARDPSGLIWILEFNHNKLFIADPSRDDFFVQSGITLGRGPESIVFIEGSGL